MLLFQRRDEAGQGVNFAKIERSEGQGARRRGGDFLSQGGALAPRDRDHAKTFRDQTSRDREAKAAAGAGDDDVTHDDAPICRWRECRSRARSES